MRAKVTSAYLGSVGNPFADKSNGETIHYRKADFSVRGTDESFLLSIPKDLDASDKPEFLVDEQHRNPCEEHRPV
ncbi:hypothetical protein [Raoultibacter timonensis]|uniref:hypothetical protein n=1 Tax=Raoultibacter timonensis TaxID=1907662 RepID=UPI0026DD0CC3|nr:hypothetical protein [Raoultibacter timonensis]